MDELDLTRIAKNDAYELEVDKRKNYLKVSFFGVWNKTSPLDDYLEDISYALKQLLPGFHLMIDLIPYKGSTSEYMKLHVDAQKMALKAGLDKTAIVLPNNQMLKVTVDYILAQSGVNACYFSNIPTARRWLFMQ